MSVYFPLQATGEGGDGGAGVVAGPKHFGTAAKAEIIKFAHRAESHTKLPMSKTHFEKYFPLLSPLIFNPSSLPPLLCRVECATWRGNSCSTLGFNSQPENLELFQCICERDSGILHMLLDCSKKGMAREGGGMLIWAD